MIKTLEVLVVESHPRAADDAAAALEAAGHRVHRCHNEADRGFPCRGVLEAAACPLHEHIDVALLVRRRINPSPTPLEGGVTCAIRARVPIVEEGLETLDPFTPWITTRLQPGADVVSACTDTVHLGFEPLYRRIAARISALLTSADIDRDDVGCRIEPDGSSLHVHLSLPVTVERSFEQALAVRVLDALRDTGPTFGHVDVHVHTPDPTPEEA